MNEIGVVVKGDVRRIGDVWGHYVSLFNDDSESKSLHVCRKLVIIACRATSECAARAASSANIISCISTRRTSVFSFSLASL